MGIGNTAPQSTLSVGNASVSNSNGTISVAKNNGSGGNRQFQMGYDSNFNMVFGDAGGNNIIAWVSQFTIAYNAPASSLVINGSGQVGIGTGNPAFGLDVFTGGVRVIATQSTGNLMHNTGPLSDNAYVLGWSGYRWISLTAVNGTIQTSDSSVKNASPLPYGLAEVLKMNTILYKWKSQDALPDTDPTKNYQYYGFCADELSPIFPELVYDEDKTAPIQMNYSEIMPVMVNAIKEQNGMIVALQAQIALLQTRLAAAGVV